MLFILSVCCPFSVKSYTNVDLFYEISCICRLSQPLHIARLSHPRIQLTVSYITYKYVNFVKCVNFTIYFDSEWATGNINACFYVVSYFRVSMCDNMYIIKALIIIIYVMIEHSY